MIPWPWVLGAFWAGGVTLLLLQFAFMHDLANSNKATVPLKVILFGLAWPVTNTFLLLTSKATRARMNADDKFVVRHLWELPEPEPTPEPEPEPAVPPSRYAGFCDDCKPKYAAFVEREVPPQPQPCSDCLARYEAHHDAVNAEAKAMYESMCEECKKNFYVLGAR